MPSRLSNLSTNRARVTREFGDGSSLTIDYKPALITPRQLHRTQAMRDRGWENLSDAEKTELMDSTTKMLADCLITWDLTDEAGNLIPPTFDGLQDVDYLSQTALLELIMEDQRLGKSSGNGQSPASSTVISASPAVDLTTNLSHPSPISISTTQSPNGSV